MYKITIALVMVAVMFQSYESARAQGRLQPVPPKLGPNTTVPGQVPVSPGSQGTGAPLQLDPAKLKRQVTLPDPGNAQVLKDQFQKFENSDNLFRYHRTGIEKSSSICAHKPYTTQEQQAAGCKGSDTLDACMQKLYDQCMANPVAQFRKAAEDARADALALIQSLQGHVTKIDQAIKAYSQ